jgi:Flp pilus assembly protein TadD
MMINVSFAQAPVLAGSQAEGAKTSIQERRKRVSADLFTRADRIDDAIRELKAILAIDPNSAEGHLLLGIAYRSRRDPEVMGEAVAELRQALALNPAMAPARLYLAYVYLDLGRAERARQELTTALHPDVHVAHPGAGMCARADFALPYRPCDHPPATCPCCVHTRQPTR